jgi:hypothetical protein
MSVNVTIATETMMKGIYSNANTHETEIKYPLPCSGNYKMGYKIHKMCLLTTYIKIQYFSLLLSNTTMCEIHTP